MNSTQSVFRKLSKMQMQFMCFLREKNAQRAEDMGSNNTQEDDPLRFKRHSKSRSMCWTYIKLMDDSDPKIIKYTPNHAHECVLCNIKLSLSWIENKHKTIGKANINY